MAIKISNIYYMLAYAFQSLKYEKNAAFGSEDFENLHSLFAEMLLKGMNRQIKRGVNRDYSLRTEALSGVRGRIDITKSISGMTHMTRQLICEYDEFTEDTLQNRVIKAAITVLLRHGELSPRTRNRLKRLITFLSGVKDIRPAELRFDLLKTQKVNVDYRMLISLCRLLFDGLLMTNENGNYILRSFLPDEKMYRLYERFVREYYRHHYQEFDARAGQIKWDTNTVTDGSRLPIMQSDTMMNSGNKVLIIDTKWYSKTMTSYFGKTSYHAGNMYQIYSYVSNEAKGSVGNVCGVLLYAKTDEPIPPDGDYMISGNRILVKTLDLTKRFDGIQMELNEIANILKDREK